MLFSCYSAKCLGVSKHARSSLGTGSDHSTATRRPIEVREAALQTHAIGAGEPATAQPKPSFIFGITPAAHQF